MRFVISIFFALLLTPFNRALAQNFQKKLDYTQESISNKLFNVTNRIDTYFGEQVPLNQRNGSHIRFEYTATAKEENTPLYEPNLDVRVRFRQLERLFRFNLTSVTPREDETLQNDQGINQANEDKTIESAVYRASLGFFKEQKRFWSLSFDTGVRVQAPAVAFAKARGQRSFDLENSKLRVINRVYVEDLAGAFNYTDIIFSKQISSSLTFTYNNQFNWQDTTSELNTSHGPSLFQVFDDKQDMSYNFRTTFYNRPNYAITAHQLYGVYRRKLYKQWILLQLIPGISFSADDDFKSIGFFTAKFQTLFGDF